MSGEIVFVLSVVGVAGALLVSARVRVDVVAILVVLAFLLSGVLTPPEALAGFGDPVVIMIAGLLVISDMLARTGVAHLIGQWIGRHGRESEVRLIVLLSLVVGLLGCFMTNTAVVAIFLPVVLSLGHKTNLNSSRLLLPLAYAGLVSGMLTLIATAPNLVVSAELERAGFEPFGFFSFTPIGGTVLLVFVLYMILVGRHLLPGERVNPPRAATRNVDNLLAEFNLLGAARRLHVPVGSPLVGHTLATAELGSRYGARVNVLERPARFRRGIITTPAADTEIRGGDVLVVHGTSDGAERLAREQALRVLPISSADRERWNQEAGIATVLIHPESSLLGRTLRAIGLRSSYGVQVLALRRGGVVLEDFLDEKLESGDAMLVLGPWRRIQQLQQSLYDFVVLALPSEIKHVVSGWKRAPAAVAILIVMAALSAFEIVPVVVAVLIAGLLAVATRCMTMQQCYSAIQWSTIVLIAGMMSITQAMTKTGAVEYIVEEMIASFGGSGPYVMLSALFVLTAVSSAILSNTATAVLLIVEPGKYRLADFIKAGVPMLILTWIVTVLLVPVLFPFG